MTEERINERRQQQPHGDVVELRSTLSVTEEDDWRLDVITDSLALDHPASVLAPRLTEHN